MTHQQDQQGNPDGGASHVHTQVVPAHPILDQLRGIRMPHAPVAQTVIPIGPEQSKGARTDTVDYIVDPEDACGVMIRQGRETTYRAGGSLTGLLHDLRGDKTVPVPDLLGVVPPEHRVSAVYGTLLGLVLGGTLKADQAQRLFEAYTSEQK